MNRLEFFNSISGIEYPDMIVNFFDQFIALKQIVDSYGNIVVKEKSDRSITFIINFSNTKYRDKALQNVQSGITMIYGRPINIHIDNLSDTELMFTLQ